MKNNIKQEINKQQATEVATPNGTVTVEPTLKPIDRAVYDEYTKELTTICNTVRTSSIDLARIFTEMDERKVLDFATDEKDGGHAVRFQSLSTYAETVLGIELSDRQLSDYKKVVHKFGTKQEDGTYTLEDKFKSYGFTALEVISRKCETKEDFDKVLTLYQLTSNMSVKKLKDTINAKDNEGKEPNTGNEAKEPKKEPKKDTSQELKETKKELEDVKQKLELANNSNDGGMVHLRDILKLAQDNRCQPILDYYTKWKLDDTLKRHFENAN